MRPCARGLPTAPGRPPGAGTGRRTRRCSRSWWHVSARQPRPDNAMADRVLVVSSRFPWPPVTGDRGRVVAWLEALAPHANVTLVAPEGRVPVAVPPFRFVPVHRSAARLASAAWQKAETRLPGP